MIKVETILEFESGNQYKVVKVHNQSKVDMKARTINGYTLPDDAPIYRDINLKYYKILS